MPSPFDASAWRSRAEKRFSSGELSEQLEAIEGIERVVAWCSERGLAVAFSSRDGGQYVPSAKTIFIPSQAKPKKQLHTLLHECGHFLIEGCSPGAYEKGYDNNEPGIERTIHHRCDIVEEEFEAWKRGFSLAARLGISLRKEDYDRTKIEGMITYIRWAGKKQS